MSDIPANLFEFTLEALQKNSRPQPLRSPRRGMWSDSAADLSTEELNFLPYRPAAAALSDWFYACTPEIPEGYPWLEFCYALIEANGRVLLQRKYGGKDPDIVERANREIHPKDISEELKTITIPKIGIDCTDLYTPLSQALLNTEKHRLDFVLDPSPMGGSYLRFKDVEKALDSLRTAERLYHLLFAILMEWSLDIGGAAPYTIYNLQWDDGHIRLQCTPDHASDIPDEVMEEVLKETALPNGIDTDQSPSWVLSDLEIEYPEVYATIEKKALAITIEEYTLDKDLTDMLKGTANLPWNT